MQWTPLTQGHFRTVFCLAGATQFAGFEAANAYVRLARSRRKHRAASSRNAKQKCYWRLGGNDC